MHPRSSSIAVALAFAAGGCLESGVTRCADGRICAAGLVCDDVSAGCLSSTPCRGHADGDRCRGLGVPDGVCQAGICAASCGDGWLEGDETCDDGGLLSHDGCSSRCTIETTTWTARSSAVSPDPRDGHAMAYDAARGRVVLFGGDAGTTPLGDTWEWDGSAWTLRTPNNSPPARFSHAMAYDGARGVVVLFGGVAAGFLNDTWEWDGSSWTERTPSVSPSARFASAMAYDAARGVVVLFGGSDATDLADTWEWNGTIWAQVTPAVSPTARYSSAMAYDATRGRIVMFGGYGGGRLGDTWEWDGSAWTGATPPMSPGARVYHAMVSELGGRVLLFGGGDNETWEWDGSGWTQTAAATSPSPRSSHAMAYDAARGRAVLFGGADTADLGDTWEFRYVDAQVPDETCVAGIDGDGDGLVGCDDPDCWGYCTPLCPPGAVCDPIARHCGDGTCNPDLEIAVCPGDCP